MFTKTGVLGGIALAGLGVASLALAEPAPVPTVRAVVVGVSDFEKLGSEDDHGTGVGDAELFANTLKKIYDKPDIRLLLGPAAGHKAIRDEVRRVLDGAAPGDTVVLYFATQGIGLGQAGYLLGADSERDSRVAASSVPIAELKKLIAASPAANVVIYADVVHQPLAASPSWKTGPDNPVLAWLDALSTARPRGNVDVFMSKGSAPVDAAAAGTCAGRGLFTCAVVAALEGAGDLDKDGRIATDEMIQSLATVYQQLDASLPAPVLASNPTVAVADIGKLAWFPAPGRAMADTPPLAAPLAATGPVPATLPAPATRPPYTFASNVDWTRPTTPQVEVCVARNGQPAGFADAFRSGDILTVSATIPEAGHLYIVNVDPRGQVSQLFPYSGLGNAVKGGRTVRIFPVDHTPVMRFDDNVGTERVFLVWAATPLADEGAVAEFATRRSAGAVQMDALADSSGVGEKGFKALVLDFQPNTGITLASHAQPTVAAVQPIAQYPNPSGIWNPCAWYKPDGSEVAWVIEFALRHEA